MTPLGSPARWAALPLILLVACSSGGGGSSSDPDASPSKPKNSGVGSALNDAWDVDPLDCTGGVTGGTFAAGDFAVTVAEGEMSRCANATSPSATAQALPSELELHAGDALVTAGGESYRVDVGDRGFHTNSPGAVTIRVPFEASKVAADKRDGLHVFLRFHVPSDHALVDVTGTLDGDVVRAELRGLPASVDVAVIYNPDMRAVRSAAPKKGAPAVKVQTAGGKLTPAVWGAHAWCAVYNPADPTVISAVSEALALTGPPSLAELDAIAQGRIAEGAAKAQIEYEAQGFLQPDLYIATTDGEPCGGTDPRFLVHYLEHGNKYVSADAGEVIGPDGNHFGRLYVSTGATNWTLDAPGATVLEVIAHELLHAVQSGYGLAWGVSWKGYKEGASTMAGRTFALGAKEAQVRSLSPEETFLLSNFVMTSTSPADRPTYSNQDFLAFVARSRSGGSPSYLAGLFRSLHDAVEAAAADLADPAAQDALRAQPPRSLLLRAMDASFTSFLSTDVRSEYIDFLRERAFDHGPNGYFARAGEKQEGFAEELFAVDADPNKSARLAMTADPEACTVETPVFVLPAVAPLAARVVTIKPSTTTDAPVALHIKVEGGGAGKSFGGIAHLGTVTQTLENETVVDGFGKTNESLAVAFANLDFESRNDLTVRVTCEAMSGTTVPLKAYTWPLGDQGEFTVESSVTGNGATVTSDESSSSYHVAQVDLATTIPASLGVSLRVVAPSASGTASSTTSHTIVGYTYTTKQPTEQTPVSTGPTMHFTLDASNTRAYGKQLYQFDVDVTVLYRTTTTYEDAEGQTQTASSRHSFVALSLLVYVNVP